MVTPQQFGATGNGSDQTAAMQQWAAAVGGGAVGYLPQGNYGISQPLMFRSTAVIGGDSMLASQITLLSPTMNGLDFVGSGRIDLHDFAIFPASAQTAGAGISVPGARDSYVGSSLRRIWMPWNMYEGINTVGLSTFVMKEIDISAVYPFIFENPGDSVVEGRCSPLTSNGIGVLVTGDCGGLKLVALKINGSNYNCAVSCILGLSDGDIQFIGGSYEGWAQSGIIIDTRAGVNFNNIQMLGTQLSGVGRGIYFPNSAKTTSTGRVIVSDCVIQDTQGSYIDGVKGLILNRNVCANPFHLGPLTSGVINDNLIAGIA
jgi:hypothetical protein